MLPLKPDNVNGYGAPPLAAQPGSFVPAAPRWTADCSARAYGPARLRIWAAAKYSRLTSAIGPLGAPIEETKDIRYCRCEYFIRAHIYARTGRLTRYS